MGLKEDHEGSCQAGCRKYPHNQGGTIFIVMAHGPNGFAMPLPPPAAPDALAIPLAFPGTKGRRASGSLTEQIFRALAGKIEAGELAPGIRLPAVRTLARHCDVSVETVLRAYNRLVAHGHANARRGSGFYVRQGLRPAERPPAWAGPASPADWRRLLHPDLPWSSRPGSGALSPEWFDGAELAACLRSTSRLPLDALCGYAEPQGYLPLREQLRHKLWSQGIHASSAQIVTTSGAIDALHLVIWSNFFPGSYVMVEDPCCFMHVQRAMASGLEVVRVARQDDGPDIDAMRALCLAHRPRAFLCSSFLHNPTSGNISAHKALQVLRLAEEFDFMVIDDDSYGDLMPQPGPQAVVRLAAMDQLQRVIHIGGFSKTLPAGLRVGYLAASPQHVERILLYKAVGAISTSPLGEHAVYELLSQGYYRRHCERLCARLDEHRPRIRALLAAHGCEVQPADAGLYLWADLGAGIDARAAADALLEQGHLMAPAAFFTSAPPTQSFMRFNVGLASGGPSMAALWARIGR